MTDAEKVAVLCAWAGWERSGGYRSGFDLGNNWRIRQYPIGPGDLYFCGCYVGPALDSGEFAWRLLEKMAEQPDEMRQMFFLSLAVDTAFLQPTLYHEVLLKAKPRAICEAILITITHRKEELSGR